VSTVALDAPQSPGAPRGAAQAVPRGHRLRLGDPVFRVVVDDLARLEQGADAGLDCICDGVLTGSPFVYTDGDLRTQTH